MPLMKWEDSYNTGIEEMDEQHKKWLERLNQFYDQMEKDKKESNLGCIFDEIIRYTMYHFVQEEAFMKKNRYPGYEKQKREHEKISARLFEYKTMFDEGWFSLSSSVAEEMKNWFSSHI